MLQRNGTPSGANRSSTPQLALLAKAPGPTLSPLPDPPRENTRRVRCADSVPYKPGTRISIWTEVLKYSITFNFCAAHQWLHLRRELVRAATAVRFTSRRIIRSGPTQRTASTQIRSLASLSASRRVALTLVNFTCSIMWSFSRPKL